MAKIVILCLLGLLVLGTVFPTILSLTLHRILQAGIATLKVGESRINGGLH